MTIEKTGYYQSKIAFLYQPEYRRHVTFYEDGFTYTAEGMAISFERESKSKYRVVIITQSGVMQQVYKNISEAMADVRSVLLFPAA